MTIMARIWCLLRGAITVFIVDITMINFYVLARDITTVEKSFEAYRVVPSLVPKAPKDVAQVQYISGVSVNEGNVLTPTQVKDKPSVKWDADTSQFYTVAMTDLDVPSSTDPQKHEFHHWLVGNVPGTDVEAGETLYEYIGSGPPPGTALHRYVFLIFKQPSKITFDKSTLDNSSLVSRGMFSIAEFAKQYNLGDPVAGNFYQAEYDDFVPELYRQLKAKYNL